MFHPMRLRISVLALASACLLASTMPVQVALADPTADQLSQLKAQEQVLKASLDQLSSQQQAAQAALAQLRADYGAKQSDYQQALGRAEGLSRQIAAMDARQKQLQQQHAERIGRFRSLSRSLYK